MLGLLVILILSWLLLYITQKQNILVLGMVPTGRRLLLMGTGLLITATLCVLVQYLEAYLSDYDWLLNDQMSSTQLLQMIRWDLQSVLTEELIFRGALLYLLIQKIGTRKSILLSAIAFGVYHWFSYGVLGNIMAMVVVLIGTGLMGYAWAWAYAKTRTILLPIGLHLGWNVTYNTVFSKGPLGDGLLIAPTGQELTDWISLLNFLTGLVFVPMIVLEYVRFGVKSTPVAAPNSN